MGLYSKGIRYNPSSLVMCKGEHVIKGILSNELPNKSFKFVFTISYQQHVLREGEHSPMVSLLLRMLYTIQLLLCHTTTSLKRSQLHNPAARHEHCTAQRASPVSLKLAPMSTKSVVHPLLLKAYTN
ncbi:hypothetical protein HPP92_002128 [Vanilla planifolia]|uniref:Uncharacterized protein n=1 Tax=Vanilla planifolia TaxID=51239 RepID=A0A835VG02_VANPL|nr:hypothetical protein HPP92_002128 [Vanilla planifolia]